MTSEKFVVRLLDAEHQLLAWAEVWAQPKPQATRASCPFWPVAQTLFAIERDGVVSHVAIHWCDLDIARMAPVNPPQAVQVGQVFTYTWLEPVWLTAGMKDVPLPAVTVRGRADISVATGALGVKSHVV